MALTGRSRRGPPRLNGSLNRMSTEGYDLVDEHGDVIFGYGLKTTFAT